MILKWPFPVVSIYTYELQFHEMEGKHRKQEPHKSPDLILKLKWGTL